MKRGNGFVDLTGQTFNFWTVLSEAPQHNYRTYWRCQCKCGTIRDLQGLSITSGKSKSCGCIRGRGPMFFSGHSRVGNREPEYRTWLSMIARCTNPNAPHYERYGGRGIKICDSWVASYGNFLTDMGRKPTPKHTLERLDNNGNYEPSNCRWATRKEQAQNRTHNIKWQHRSRDDKGRFA